MPEDTRIDRWLCAVRLVKSRPMATRLCEAGHVRVNGNPAKPSTKVRAGDVVHALIAGRERIVEVVQPIETRVGAAAAAMCYVDNSPPPVVREIAPGIKAVRGEGRPSKRLRRELERMRRAGPG
jgi:ribosome-associated heat shock protein Hsp15